MADAPRRPEKIALVTGSLAEPRLARIAGDIADPALDPVVVNVGVKVAALMTAEIVERRLKLPEGTDRVLMPGRFRGDLERLERFFGVPFSRGPDEMADLPDYFGQQRRAVDLSKHDVTIFAEIVDATLELIDNQIDPQSGTLRVKSVFPNKGDKLWPGQFVDLRLRVATLPGVVTVPSDAVQRGPGGPFVYTVDADNKVAATPVELGQIADGIAVVTKGLGEGQIVVAHGQYRLAPGALVTPIPAPGSAPSGS